MLAHARLMPAALPSHVSSPQNTGTSLLETFDADQIRTHCRKLADAARQAPAKQSNSASLLANPNDACSVCSQTKLTFEPPCLYCTQCGQRIKRGQTFHCTPQEYEIKGWWCHGCFSENKGERVPFEGAQVGTVKSGWSGRGVRHASPAPSATLAPGAAGRGGAGTCAMLVCHAPFPPCLLVSPAPPLVNTHAPSPVSSGGVDAQIPASMFLVHPCAEWLCAQVQAAEKEE